MIPDGCEEVNRRIGYRKERPMYKKGSKDEEESPSGQMIRRTKRKRALSTLLRFKNLMQHLFTKNDVYTYKTEASLSLAKVYQKHLLGNANL